MADAHHHTACRHGICDSLFQRAFRKYRCPLICILFSRRSSPPCRLWPGGSAVVSARLVSLTGLELMMARSMKALAMAKGPNMEYADCHPRPAGSPACCFLYSHEWSPRSPKQMSSGQYPRARFPMVSPKAPFRQIFEQTLARSTIRGPTVRFSIAAAQAGQQWVHGVPEKVSPQKATVAVPPPSPARYGFSSCRRRLFLVFGWRAALSSPCLFGQSGKGQPGGYGDGCSTRGGL